VLDIATAICWISEDGFEVVSNALCSLIQQKKYRFKIEPFIKVLENSNNVVLISNVCSFINTLVEAPPTLPRRVQIKEELLV